MRAAGAGTSGAPVAWLYGKRGLAGKGEGLRRSGDQPSPGRWRREPGPGAAVPGRYRGISEGTPRPSGCKRVQPPVGQLKQRATVGGAVQIGGPLGGQFKHRATVGGTVQTGEAVGRAVQAGGAVGGSVFRL